MKKIFGWVALLVGMVTGANAQVNDTIQRTTGNDLYQGITRKLPYRQMVTPHGVQVTEGKSDVRTVYAVPQFTIPDDKLLVIELFEKDGGRHQTIRVENADLVAARQINELKIK